MVLTRQAVEVVQLAVSMWSEKHDRIVIGELVRAILLLQESRVTM